MFFSSQFSFIMKYRDVLIWLSERANPNAIEGMARYGITPQQTFGLAIPNLRALAKEIGNDHTLAQQLWRKNNRETRILASMIEDVEKANEAQLDAWVKCFDYWEICDQCCMNLFEKTRWAYKKAKQWSRKKEEFVRRAGFVMMARLAVSDKQAENKQFEPFFPLIIQYSTDERNYVKKAVNWALRQIGKRNVCLHRRAIQVAKEIRQIDNPAARWIAADALRELTGEKVQQRLKKGKLRND